MAACRKSLDAQDGRTLETDLTGGVDSSPQTDVHTHSLEGRYPNVQLYVSYQMRTDGDANSQARLRYSTNGGGSWTTIHQEVSQSRTYNSSATIDLGAMNIADIQLETWASVENLHLGCPGESFILAWEIRIGARRRVIR